MSTDLSRFARTVVVERHGDSPRSFEYGTLREAQGQADRWVAESLRFVHADGIDGFVVRLGPRSWHVLGYSSRQVSVREIPGDGDGRFWSQGERIACLQRRFGLDRTEDIRNAYY